MKCFLLMDAITAGSPSIQWAVWASVTVEQGNAMWHTARGLHTVICLSWKKIRENKKRGERDQAYGITNGECYKTRWKMGILILDNVASSAKWKPAKTWCEGAESRAMEWVFIYYMHVSERVGWAYSDLILKVVYQSALDHVSLHTHTISPLQNKQRMWWSKGL